MREWSMLALTLLAAGTFIYWFSDYAAPGQYSSRTSGYPSVSISELIELTENELDSTTTPLSASLDDEFEYVLAIPDVHGDAEHFIRSIWIGLAMVNRVKITFADFEQVMTAAAFKGVYPDAPLSTPRTLLVQMGDLVDRGPDSVECLRIMWAIERVTGWQVVSLYGNHELMSAFGNERHYIHGGELHEFGSMEARYRAFRAGHPLGEMIHAKSVGMTRILSPNSNRGILFVHAGIEPLVLEEHFDLTSKQTDAVDAFNRIFTAAVSTMNKEELLRLALANNSTVWTRMLARTPEPQLCTDILPHLLLALDVERIVIGHTPQDDHRMKIRCESRIIITDVGMSKWMFGDEGQPAILALKRGEVDSPDWESIRALYFDNISNRVVASSLRRSIFPRYRLIEGGECAQHMTLLRGLFKSILDDHLIFEAEFDCDNIIRKGVVTLESGDAGWQRFKTMQTGTDHILDHGLIDLFGVEFSFALLNTNQQGFLELLTPASALSPKDHQHVDQTVDSLHASQLAFDIDSIDDLLTHFARDTETNELHLVSLRAADMYADAEQAKLIQSAADRFLTAMFEQGKTKGTMPGLGTVPDILPEWVEDPTA